MYDPQWGNTKVATSSLKDEEKRCQVWELLPLRTEIISHMTRTLLNH